MFDTTFWNGISISVKTVIPIKELCTIANMLSMRGWKDRGNANYDYGMIVVDRPSSTWMSYGYDNNLRLNNIINIAGYPGDKSGSCMWRSSCDVARRYTNQLGYRCDTCGGMSGFTYLHVLELK